ncbi:MAG: valine--tRNA ligase [Patescibacteria group bacterium]
MKEISKAYEPQKFEEKIYNNWEKSGYFKPEVNLDGKPFTIMMPPPNVTGKLHLGHAMFSTLEDILTRYHRLLGEPSLWLPGTDHAGIATQTVVDKSLRKKGINKNEIGRDKFVEEVWKWKEEHGNAITNQLRRLGSSCDWSRERFTLDEGLNKAVNEAFTRLYKKGLIYRGNYIVNWCPKCHTAIADDEVEHIEKSSKLYYFKYDKNFPITIATTRPETKLGDVAVAVNSNDKRYKEFIGKEYEIDLDGVKRKIKIIADRSIDEKFGTGAVGVTPAHSMTDWKMSEDHKLEKIKVIDENGRMTEEAGKYQGLKTKEAAEKLIQYFKENDLLEKEEDYTNNLSVCYRCGGTIEPLPSLQWFVKMAPLAEKAKEAVRSGQIKIIPERFEKVYFHWMDNIRDWCISRQLWWGHQIPVWYRRGISNSEFLISNEVPNPKFQDVISTHSEPAVGRMNEGEKSCQGQDNIYVGVEPPKDIENWEQDEDVLDTWFSSSLWPFSTLGWPQETNDLKSFYPTNVLETGYDILFFWVARMIMMGLELTGEVPFETVYLHGLVRDEHNRKMSKSLGNVLDPLDIIDKYGTDALRMALVVGSTPGQDVALGEAKIKGYRNFSNKIWNASRFVMLRVSEGDIQSGKIGETKVTNLNIDEKILTGPDKEILKKHEEVKKSITKKLNEFRFSHAGEEIYDYFWHDFCDEYIEVAKTQLTTDNLPAGRHGLQLTTKKVLIKVLSETLIMLHPFVPFVTEAVWQELRNIYPELCESIMISKWPKG